MAIEIAKRVFTADQYQRMTAAGIFGDDAPVELIDGALVEKWSLPGARHMFTVDEYYRIAEFGIFSEDDRIELIEGDIVAMSPIGSRHAGCVIHLITLLASYLGEFALLTVQNPIRMGAFSELQPDLALLRPREDDYRMGHPGPGDILLLIEVADTTIKEDRNVKIPLYARAGVAEVWLIDLNADVIETYSRPDGGEYRLIFKAGRGDSISARGVPGLTLSVEAILGPLRGIQQADQD